MSFESFIKYIILLCSVLYKEICVGLLKIQLKISMAFNKIHFLNVNKRARRSIEPRNMIILPPKLIRSAAATKTSSRTLSSIHYQLGILTPPSSQYHRYQISRKACRLVCMFVIILFIVIYIYYNFIPNYVIL